MTLTIDIEKTIGGFDIYLSDDFGGSGIKVNGATSNEVVDNLMPYIHDYLSNLESIEEED